jgi:hypothetical protein
MNLEQILTEQLQELPEKPMAQSYHLSANN